MSDYKRGVVKSCILVHRERSIYKDKTFQTSLDVSSYIDKILFKFGCDRGSGDLIMMISLMNRLKGNHGKHALAIGVAEGAQETYANLKKTVYSNDRKEILEQLVNRHLYMIQLTFIKANGINASTIGTVKCIIMQLKGIDRDVLSKTKFVVQTEEYSPIGNAVSYTHLTLPTIAKV